MAEATALWELLRQTADPAPFRFERLARASKWVPLLRAKPIELERLRGMTALARSAGRPARFGFALSSWTLSTPKGKARQPEHLFEEIAGGHTRRWL